LQLFFFFKKRDISIDRMVIMLDLIVDLKVKAFLDGKIIMTLMKIRIYFVFLNIMNYYGFWYFRLTITKITFIFAYYIKFFTIFIYILPFTTFLSFNLFLIIQFYSILDIYSLVFDLIYFIFEHIHYCILW
jgi:hypothetical protein